MHSLAFLAVSMHRKQNNIALIQNGCLHKKRTPKRSFHVSAAWRIRFKILLSSLDTCTWEICSTLATSLCVLSIKYRKRMTCLSLGSKLANSSRSSTRSIALSLSSAVAPRQSSSASGLPASSLSGAYKEAGFLAASIDMETSSGVLQSACAISPIVGSRPVSAAYCLAYFMALA